MGEKLDLEPPGRPQPLISLPRGAKTPDGLVDGPVVTGNVALGKQAAGCVICSTPIPPGTSRLELRVSLRYPVTMPTGKRRLTEKYFVHPGCITDRVRPEVVRAGMDCYDCGAQPPVNPETGFHLRFTYRVFTVSKFAPAPLCQTCSQKPKWGQCDHCTVWFPHWMVSEVTTPVEVDRDLVRFAGLTTRFEGQLCTFCAERYHVPTVQSDQQAKADFEKLRKEIAEHGVFEAGDR